jgi:signal transduction histidine kinase
MSLPELETPVPMPPPVGGLLELDQAILDALPFGIYACDGNGRIVRVNRCAVELWGRVPRLHDQAQLFCGSFHVESLEGVFIPPEKTPMARAVLAGESFEGVEAVVENPDGKRWVARVNVAPLRDADRVVIGAINYFQDVTREHEIRIALDRQQRTFDLAMTASKMGTWRYTLADNICIYDENAQRLYGLSKARFHHDEPGVKAKFHPDDVDRMWVRVTKALDPEGDGRYDVEYRVKQPDGSWRWLSAWGLVEFEGDGAKRKAVAIAGASRDLSEEKQAEQRELNNRLMSIEVATGAMAHEIKQPLAAIAASGAAGLNWIRRKPAHLDQAKECLTQVVNASHRANEMIEGIRRIFTRAIPGPRTMQQINNIVLETLNLVQHDLQVDGISVATEYEDDLPQIHADRMQIQLVILNLIKNAIEAMRSSRRGKRHLQVVTALKGNSDVSVSIRDTGPGIAVKDRESIFNPFFSTKKDGMGLGLLICRTIMENHGGKLSLIETEPGSIFEVVIPSVQTSDSRS